MKEVIENIHDIVEVIPVAVMKLCLEIESRLANYIKPLSGSVLVQLIICGLYNIILKLQLGKCGIKASKIQTKFEVFLQKLIIIAKNCFNSNIVI